MLTVKGFESSGAASKYYSHGDYYGSEGTGEWYGKGAEELGLTGEFNAATDPRFKAVLEGRINEDNPLGRMHKGKWEHRPGYDLTFSAPKSFSIEVNLRSDPKRQEELKQIMQNAAKRTLDYVAKRGLIQVRKGKAGIEKENVDKLTYALFAHSTNRKLEPQEHIHSFLANMAICEDGKMRSINVDKVINGDGTIKLLGQVFRNELAYDLKQNGEKLRSTILSDGSNSFEFAHISDGLIKAFSTRRQEIEELCEKYGVITKEGRDKIVINSREAKRKVEKADLIKTWEKVQSEVLKKEAVNSRVEVVQDEKEDEDVKNNEKSGLSTFDVAKLCVLDASSKKSVFGHNDLVKSIIKYTIGDATITKLEEAVTKLVEEGELIKHNDRYTTLVLLQKEKEILKIAKKSLNSCKPLLKESSFKKECKKFEDRQASLNNKFMGLNDSQKNGLKYILTSKDNIIAVDGLAGVGKSTILNAVRDISGRKIINLFGLGDKFGGAAPTASAAKTLQESAKVESSTLHSFIYKYKGYIEGRGKAQTLQTIKKSYSKSVIFVDEASLISTEKMHELFQLREKLGFKLVLVGDQKQLGAVEAGKDFEQLIKVIPYVKLDNVIRQQNESHREAVIESSKGNIKKTFDIHDKNIEQHSKGIVSAAVAKYMEFNLKDRDNTLLMSPTKKIRDEINDQIRVELKKEKILKGSIENFAGLRQKDMSLADYNFAMMYKKDNVVKFFKNYSNGIKQNEYYKVVGINKLSNNITVEKDNKKHVFKFRTNTKYNDKLEVYEKMDLKLQEGLKIRFTKNNNKEKLVNSETAVIEKINKESIKFKTEDGEIKTVNKEELKHIDYGYCLTIHSAQGKTYEKSIAAIGDNKMLSNQKLWTVILSRHKESFTAIVQDKEKLQGYLISNNGRDMSAIELNNMQQKQVQQIQQIQQIHKVNDFQIIR